MRSFFSLHPDRSPHGLRPNWFSVYFPIFRIFVVSHFLLPPPSPHWDMVLSVRSIGIQQEYDHDGHPDLPRSARPSVKFRLKWQLTVLSIQVSIFLFRGRRDISVRLVALAPRSVPGKVDMLGNYLDTPMLTAIRSSCRYFTGSLRRVGFLYSSISINSFLSPAPGA